MSGRLEFRASTFFRHLKLAALDDLDCLLRLVARVLGHVLDLLDDLVALEHFAEDDVLAVQPRGDGGGNEELGAVGVLAGVGHACSESHVSHALGLQCVSISQRTKKTLLGVLQLEVLVGELVAVDALAAGAVALGEVTSLDHELLDNTVEVGALVAKALLASSKGTEVLSGLQEPMVSPLSNTKMLTTFHTLGTVLP